MKISCYTLAFQIYICYVFFPFIHSLPMVIQMGILGLVFALLGLDILCTEHDTSSANVVSIIILTAVFSYMVYKGEYTVTIYSFTFGYSKMFILFLFWFPLFFLAKLASKRQHINVHIFFDLSLFACTVTAITTLIGIVRYDEPCRQLAKGRPEISALYQSRNIGGYGFIYALIFFIPVLLERYKLYKKKCYLAIVLLFSVCIVLARYGTAIVVFMLIIGVYLYLEAKIRMIYKNLIAGVIALIAIISEQWFIIFAILTRFFESLGIDTLSIRMEQVYRSLNTNKQVGDLAERAQLRRMSLDVFKEHVIWGNFGTTDKQPLGMHSELCDLLGGAGLVGLVLFILLLVIVVKYIKLNSRSKNIRKIYISIGCGIIFLSYVNTIISSLEILLMIVLICTSDIDSERICNENTVY